MHESGKISSENVTNVNMKWTSLFSGSGWIRPYQVYGVCRVHSKRSLDSIWQMLFSSFPLYEFLICCPSPRLDSDQSPYHHNTLTETSVYRAPTVPSNRLGTNERVSFVILVTNLALSALATNCVAVVLCRTCSLPVTLFVVISNESS